MSLGIYVHVPFCRHVCPYCSFNVVRAKGSLPADALLCALGHEARHHARFFSAPVRTVYFGGGTPSLMSPAWIERALADVTAPFGALPPAEVTLEVEPGTADRAALEAYRRAGINRLSIGWQSDVPRVLEALGRGHTAEAATRLFFEARAAGFANINLDWMLAAPGQTEAEVRADGEALAALGPEHVSCYVLTVEPRTPFARQQARGELALPGEAHEARWLGLAARMLRRAGLARYEVASFAQPGRQSRHNRAYWSGRPYLGLGPGAHSFARHGWRRGRRWCGHRRLATYLEAWREPPALGAAPCTPRAHDFLEELAPSDMAFERVLLGLRRANGLSLAALSPLDNDSALPALAGALHARGWARVRGGRLVPTANGLLHADAAAALYAG